MTLDELKKDAEDAQADNDCCLNLNPDTVLKLLEMISVLRAGIIIAGTRLADRRDDPLNVGAGLQAYYDKADAIERSLGK